MKKVLIIDDDQLFLNLLTDYISERYPNLEILAFDNALQGLAHITADLDLLLLDLEMPELDGKDLSESKDPNGKKLFVTHSGPTADAVSTSAAAAASPSVSCFVRSPSFS